MLELITRDSLPDADRVAAALRGWWAIDRESGAFLSRAGGRREPDRPIRWVLILPNRTPEQRDGLFAPYDWDYPQGRKYLYANSVEEALQEANERLPGMVRWFGRTPAAREGGSVGSRTQGNDERR